MRISIMQQQPLYPSCNTALETEIADLQCTIFGCLCSCRRLHLCTVIQSHAVQCTIFVCVQLPYIIIFVFSCTQLCCAVQNICLCTVAVHIHPLFCKFSHTLDVCVQLPFITFLCNCSQLYCALYTVVL